MIKVGPCSVPSGSPSNSLRYVNCMALLGSGCGFWIGDGGGAEGIAGDCDNGDSVMKDADNEVSDNKLDDNRESSVDEGTMVSVLFRARKQPLLSRRAEAVIYNGFRV
jgi:hypothetical protein